MHGGGGGSLNDDIEGVLSASKDSFPKIFKLLTDSFHYAWDYLDGFKLIGNFSLLDFIIVAIIIDIVITGLFVTFNVSESGTEVGGGFAGSVGNARVNAAGFRRHRRGGG